MCLWPMSLSVFNENGAWAPERSVSFLSDPPGFLFHTHFVSSLVDLSHK